MYVCMYFVKQNLLYRFYNNLDSSYRLRRVSCHFLRYMLVYRHPESISRKHMEDLGYRRGGPSVYSVYIEIHSVKLDDAPYITKMLTRTN